jgi:hypothetical protein
MGRIILESKLLRQAIIDGYQDSIRYGAEVYLPAYHSIKLMN